MGSVDSPSDTSGEVASLGLSHIMNTASEGNFNAVSAMNQPTDPEVFRFLDLPAEIRNKIYRILLVYHEPVVLKSASEINDDIYRNPEVYVTRLGMSPQICRTSKTVACECFAVLYGDNTFHFTNDHPISFLYTDLGLDKYCDYVKSVVVDTSMSEFRLGVEEQSNINRQNRLWASVCDPFVQSFNNLQKLCFNLPRGLQILTERNMNVLLEAKRYTPKHAVVEFRGATSHIVSEIMAAWMSYVPKPIELPKWKPPPFHPLEWRKEEAARREIENPKGPSSPSTPTYTISQIATLKRLPLDECSAGEPRVSKKQKLDGEMPRCNFSPLGNLGRLLEHVIKDQFKIGAELQLHASEEKKGAVQEDTLALKEKILAEEKERLALEKKDFAEEKERFAQEKKGFTEEKERFELEKKILGLEKEKLAVE